MHIADGVWQGGLSGVAFTEDVALVSRVTQGCQPVGPTREVTACERNVIVELDGQPALPSLLADLGLPALDDPRQALPRLRATLVGVTAAPPTPVAPAGAAATQSRHRAFGDDVRVRHLIGLDPGRRAVAVAELLQPGMRVAFCQRDVAAARRDLVRICSEIRDELDACATGRRGASWVRCYVSCAGRGGPHFGGPSAELKIVQHALGDVPLVGFFAGGEIAHQHLYGYTGVLTVVHRAGLNAGRHNPRRRPSRFHPARRRKPSNAAAPPLHAVGIDRAPRHPEPADERTPAARRAAARRAPRRQAGVAALSPLLPAHALLWQSEDTIPYECDGLTAYRQSPLVVALPETEAQVAAVLKACHALSCRWWRAAPAPA